VQALLFGPPTGNVAAIIIFLVGLFVALWLLAVLARWMTERIWKGKARMQNALKEYDSLITMSLTRLLSISETESSARAAPDKWSKREILGHMIDSASNNHQRFVRAQLSSEIKLPGYDQEAWVRTQVYQTEPSENLVQLWKSYNLHLLHVAAAFPEDRLSSLCFIGENEPVTLEFLFRDYLRHLKHHLDQIFT
jgi:hypothetical protein